MIDDAAQAIFYPLKIGSSSRFPLLDGANFSLHIFAGKQFSLFRESDQRISNGLHRYFAKMHNDKWRANSICEINGLTRLLDRTLALLGMRNRKFIAVWRSAHDFHG